MSNETDTTAQLIFLEEEERRLSRAHAECDEPAAKAELWEALCEVRAELAIARTEVKVEYAEALIHGTSAATERARMKEQARAMFEAMADEATRLDLTLEERALLKVAVGYMMEHVDGRTTLAQDLAALAKKLETRR